MDRTALLLILLTLSLLFTFALSQKPTLTILGARKFSLSAGLLHLEPLSDPAHILLYLDYASGQPSPVHHYEGTLFDRPVKAAWTAEPTTANKLGMPQSAVASIRADGQRLFVSVLSDEKVRGPGAEELSPDLDFVRSHETLGRSRIVYRIKPGKKAEIRLTREVEVKLDQGTQDEHFVAGIKAYERKVNGEGFHRTVETNITFVSKHPLTNCRLYAVEPVLESHFVETDFLADIEGCEHWINEDANIELPSSVASQYFLRFAFPLRNGSVHTRFFSFVVLPDGTYNLHYAFPYHFRYQPVDSQAYRSVEVLNPELYLSCKCDTYVDKTEDELETLIKRHVLGGTKAVRIRYGQKQTTWKGKMPVAQEGDKRLVAVVTLLITLAAVVCLSKVAIQKAIKG